VLKSPVDYLSDKEYSALPLRERALHEARSQVGQVEVPKGSNWGPVVRIYLAYVGLTKPAAWCAAFTSWCLRVAGLPKKGLPTNAASTYYWYTFAKDRGLLKATPTRGSLFIWNDDGGGHIGFVVEVLSPTRFRTIEGNTNPGGSREGYGVFERERSISDLTKHGRRGFIRIDALANIGGVF